MKGIDCDKPMKKCSRFERCSVPLCPLDRQVEKRVYLEGEPTCKLDSQRLTTIADDGFKEQYRGFIRVSLSKGARFEPLKQSTARGKNRQETRSQK